jgi:reverse gyrase
MNSFWSGLFGGIVGGAAILMSDQSFRSSLKKKFSEWMDQFEEKKEEGKEKIETEIKKTRNKVARIQNNLTA